MSILFSFRFNRHSNKSILSSCLCSINKYNILETESPKMSLSKSLSCYIHYLITARAWYRCQAAVCLNFLFLHLSTPYVKQFHFCTARQYSKMVRFWSGLNHWFWSLDILFFFNHKIKQSRSCNCMQIWANFCSFRVHFLVLKNNFWLLNKTKQNNKKSQVLLNKKIGDIYVNTPNWMYAIDESCL